MDLYEAFGLSPGSIVAAVGGGGKTSLVYALGYEAAARGFSAIITSTTRFTRPAGIPMPPIIESTDAALAGDVARALAPGTVHVASAGEATRGRLAGFAPESIDALAALAPGLIAVEADGSGRRPFKAPADHEPAIPRSATDVVVCVGLEVLGHALEADRVHRPEIVARLAGSFPGAIVTAATIVRVLLHEAGGRKNVPPGARLHALLNGPRTEEHEKLGAHIAERLVYGGYHRAVVATAHRPGDIRAVVR
ncbi:MAG: putative selenium-dependent hydroxylase accessory protein YqeC [Anaerolinea sp.]|nr:putative selenium-dependent hydroxylase accessory protein YqeC [Anaerolinea sp.]